MSAQNISSPIGALTTAQVSSPPRPTRDVRHLNQTDLARRWRISPRTLERWRWLGQGPCFLKIGGRVAYRLEDIEAYEAAQIRTISGNSEERRSAA